MLFCPEPGKRGYLLFHYSGKYVFLIVNHNSHDDDDDDGSGCWCLTCKRAFQDIFTYIISAQTTLC